MENNQDIELLNILINSPQTYYKLMLSNPKFQKFVDDNKHKTTKEIAKDYKIECLEN